MYSAKALLVLFCTFIGFAAMLGLQKAMPAYRPEAASLVLFLFLALLAVGLAVVVLRWCYFGQNGPEVYIQQYENEGGRRRTAYALLAVFWLACSVAAPFFIL